MGTHTTPTAKPWMALLTTRISIVTLRSKVSIQNPAAVCRPKPKAMLMRGSIRLMKPAIMKPSNIPMPRHPITCPTSESGKPACCCSSGGSKTIGVKFNIP